MPGLRVFGRRWGVASDDLVFPGSFEFFVRAIWWIVMLVLYTGQRTELSHCEGGATLSTFLLGNIIILLAVLLVLACVVYTSMQGTIGLPYKRRRMPNLVYARTLLYAPELVWTVLGSAWSVRLRSVADCGDEALTAMKGAVATSWIIMLATLVTVALAFDPLGGHSEASGGGDGGGADSMRLLCAARGTARRVWETRVRLLCCWLGDEDHGGAFSEIARVLSDFFLDTDLVASDIAAGLSLLHQQQDRQGPREVVTEGPLSLIAHPQESLNVELDSAAHYAKFAWAAYGWPMYVLQNPLSGLSVFFENCSCRRGGQQSAEYSLVGGGDGGDGRHVATVLRVTGLCRNDLIHVSFHNAVYQIPFFVALDHDTQAVVVSVRGTLSLRDVLTDLSADCESMQVDGLQQDCYAHKGMIQAATFIHQRLVNDGILNEAFQQAQDYHLVVTGHSMGGGVAVLLSILLRCAYPRLRCYAFSPPGGLLSQTLAHYTREFVLSVVVGKDVVARLSLSNMEDLKQSIIQIISASNRPKYQILLLGCCYEVCGVSSGTADEESEVQRTRLLQPLLSTGDLSEDQQPMVCTAWVPPPDFTLSLALSSGTDLADGPPASVSLAGEASLIAQQQPLFLPGRILHLVDDDEERGASTGRSCIGGARRFHARWEDPSAFRTLLISPRMFTDHTPHAISHALRQLTSPAAPDHRPAAPSGIA
ncbi:diacylglycerol lipase-beta-like isoform X1 [Lampetra fluviatilis]